MCHFNAHLMHFICTWVRKAIKKQGVRNLFFLNLPLKVQIIRSFNGVMIIKAIIIFTVNSLLCSQKNCS